MSKTIIVMRHGKAKRGDIGQADQDRELTEAGVRSLAATLRGSLQLWPDEKRAEVWASPAVRAQQTAGLLMRALRKRDVKVGELKTVESLWTADEWALLEDIRYAEADVIALVGHNPFSEEFVQALTGSDIVFATGAMAAVELEFDEDERVVRRPEGRLLWFVQGPISQRWKTLVTMEKRLADAMDVVDRRYDEFFADPEDIETMHALRVSMRRARSLAAFVAPWQDAGQNEQVQDDLRDVARLTSRQRELDVMWEQVEADDEFSDELASFCASLAADERGKTMKALSAKRVRKSLERVRENMKNVRWKRRYAESGLETADVRARFDRMTGKLADNLESLDLADVEGTHDVRKQAKRARYSAEGFKEVLGDDAVGVAKEMVAHQDDLGAICDARVNIDIVNGLSSDDLPEPVSWELALLRARYETFLYTALRDSREAAAVAEFSEPEPMPAEPEPTPTEPEPAPTAPTAAQVPLATPDTPAAPEASVARDVAADAPAE